MRVFTNEVTVEDVVDMVIFECSSDIALLVRLGSAAVARFEWIEVEEQGIAVIELSVNNGGSNFGGNLKLSCGYECARSRSASGWRCIVAGEEKTWVKSIINIVGRRFGGEPREKASCHTIIKVKFESYLS